MKKIICLTLCILFCIGSIAMVSYAGTEENTDCEELIVLKALEILPQELDGSVELTRAEAVEYILRLRNITSYSNSGERSFLDISVYDKYYALTDTAKSLGIIKGDPNGSFRPDDSVSAQEATIMLMRAMGYGNIVDAMGGGMYDYISKATESGFVKGIDLSQSGMTANAFAKLIYNSFSIGIVEANSFGVNTGYEIGNKTSLSYLGLAMGEGVLTDNEYVSIHYTVNQFTEGQVIIGGISYKIGETDANELLGYHVEYYFYDNQDDVKELKYLRAKDNTVMTVSLTNDITAKDGKLVYIEANDKEREIKVNAAASMIVNGTAKPLDLSRLAAAGSTGEMILVDNGNDLAGYDVVILNDYKNDVVLGYDSETSILNLKYAGKITIPEKDYGYLYFYENGVKANDSSLSNGKVISWLKSENGTYFKGILNGNILEAELSGIQKEDRTYYELKETAYALAGDCKNASIAELGGTYQFALNYNNEIVDVHWVSVRNYAFVMGVSTKSVELEDQISVKLYTSNGANIFALAEKLSFDGERTDKNTEGIISYINANSQENLIAYELNSNGEISNIDFCANSTGNLLEDSMQFTKYVQKTEDDRNHFNGSVINGIGAKTAQAFFIPAGTNIDEEECRVSTLTRSTYYPGLVFYDVGMDGNAAAILVRSGATNAFQGYPTPVVFAERVEAVNNNGEIVEKIYYYQDGKKSSVTVSDKVALATLSPYTPDKEYKFSDLKFGDIFAFETNLQGQLNYFTVFYSGSANAKTDKKIYYGGGVVESAAQQLFSGDLCYMEQGIFSLNHAGGFEIFNYTDEVPVYKIDTERQKVYEIDMGTLRVKNYYDSTDVGQRVIAYGDRYNLKGVYTYE